MKTSMTSLGRRAALLAALLTAGAAACGGSGTPASGSTPDSGSTPGDPAAGGPSSDPSPVPTTPGWTVAAREDFEASAIPTGAFAPDPVPDDGPFSDGGSYFTARGVTPPTAYRATRAFGDGGWLTLESYSRRSTASLSEHAAIVKDPDPANPSNHVLRLRSPQHTDATVVRPSAALPARYRVSLRVGYAAFGDGKPVQNGYDGTENAGPWWPDEDARQQNGFYWLTILDQQPRPHNNTWIHHHRKIVVDSDNHYPPWMEIWDGSRFASSGEHPVMMIALDGTGAASEHSGNSFLSYSGGAWQPSGAIRAVDAYRPNTWYRLTIERDGPSYTIEVSGDFAFGGQQTYRATIDAADRCVWHYPVNAEEAAGAAACVGKGILPGLTEWNAGESWPDWFMFGDPHVNYYEGEVYYDDVTLEVWRD
jgi:hypothetical protein